MLIKPFILLIYMFYYKYIYSFPLLEFLLIDEIKNIQINATLHKCVSLNDYIFNL